jgi:hypothetical protein
VDHPEPVSVVILEFQACHGPAGTGFQEFDADERGKNILAEKGFQRFRGNLFVQVFSS